ncbi:MAG: hypothetical protein ACON31_03125, partial [Candidatus Puniceispirillaceae bacterium]
APEGGLTVPGILTDPAVRGERRYAGAGARAVSRLRIGEWTTLVMRPAAHPTRLGGLSGLWHPRDRHQTASLQDSR